MVYPIPRGPSLFHITKFPRACRILREGLKVGMVPREADPYGNSLTSPEWDFSAWGERNIEADARDLFNGVLSHTMPRSRRFPGHDRAVFFWGVKHKAMQHPGIRGDDAIVEVDVSRVPCGCWRGSSDLAEKVFSAAVRAFEAAEDTEFPDEPEEGSVRKAAKEYWKSFKPLHPGKRRIGIDDEILCPCDIPARAVRHVDFRGADPKEVCARRES